VRAVVSSETDLPSMTAMVDVRGAMGNGTRRGLLVALRLRVLFGVPVSPANCCCISVLYSPHLGSGA
jgi:hypothetical protein